MASSVRAPELRGHCSWERGQFGDAHDYWTAAADSYKLMGRTNLLLNALDLLCKADFEMARDLEYRQLIVEVERLGHECGNDRQVTQALLHRASQSVVLCDLPAAQECLDRANALISQLDQEVPKLSLSLDWARGDYLLAQQRPAEALECLTRAKRCAQDQRMRVTLATIRNDYGKALIALDRLEHASAVLLDAESVLELCSATPALAKTYALWARYWWKKGDPTAAAQALEEARALARHLPICGRTLERELEAAANLIGQ